MYNYYYHHFVTFVLWTPCS